MIELAVRLVFSLAVVVGLLWAIARVGSRRFRGRNGAMVQIVHRQPLSRSSSVAVVTVGTRVLVLGTTEQQVTILTELDPDEIDLDGDGEVVDEDGDTVERVLPAPVDLLPHLVPVTELRPAPGKRAARPTPAPQAVDAPAERAARPSRSTAGSRSSGRHAARPQPATATGPLAGSVLSPDTWRQAMAAATRRIS
ncbi:MAG: flagellar biosynthetic protein FliO [Nocardioidaceae bacterium]